MGHVGLRPQSVHLMGGYRVQRDEERLLEDAMAAQNAGAFSLVMECVPAELAGRISKQLAIPTIGIGSGPLCDGQVLVLHDLIGMTSGYTPSFVRQYAQVGNMMETAISAYCEEVRNGQFPSAEHGFD